MPDWMSWLHLPDLTDIEHRKRKQAYTDKYGYTVTVPGLSDIFILGVPEPVNSAEALQIKRGELEWLPPGRYEEIQAMKKKKKENYLRMLSSPTPWLVQNAGSILTAVDDAQDAVSTLGYIGALTRAIAPKSIAKALLGPVGIIWAAADILNLIQSAPYACMGWRFSKREYEEMSKRSPKQIRARARRPDRLAYKMPRKADWIQAAQVTTSVFGYGISLGPLVGLFQDIHFGTSRFLTGEPVKVKLPTFSVPKWVQKAYKGIKSLGAALTYPIMTDDEDTLTLLSSSTLAFQCLHDRIQQWHPLDMIEDPENVLVRAPIPEDPLTLEVIEEVGIPLSEVVGWPQTNQLWSTIGDLADATQWGVTQNLDRFVLRNKHSFMGLVGASTAVDSSMFALATIENPETVSFDYKPSSKAAVKMIGNTICLDPTQPPAKLRDFAGYLYQNDNTDHNPTLREIINYCNGPAAIKLVEY